MKSSDMTKDELVKVEHWTEEEIANMNPRTKEEEYQNIQKEIQHFIGRKITDIGIPPSFSCVSIGFDDGSRFRMDGWNYERGENQEILFCPIVKTHPPAGGEQGSPETLTNQPNPSEPETNGGLGDVSCSASSDSPQDSANRTIISNLLTSGEKISKSLTALVMKIKEVDVRI